MAAYAVFVSWADLIVRGIRGEEVEENWRTFSSTVALIVFFTLASGGRVHQTESLRNATTELRDFAHEASSAARERERLADLRDARDSAQQARLGRLTIWLVALAALTLGAAIVTLVVSIVDS